MKILFYGDSITDADRNRDGVGRARYGNGFVMQIASRMFERAPMQHEILNTGISGNRIVDLYARIKRDAWNLKPDVMSILIGVNDVWHEVGHQNGVELDRFERIFRMLIDDTLKGLPDVKIILCEPFVLHGTATNEKYDQFEAVFDYAKVVRRLAEAYSLPFVPLQKKLEEAAEAYGEATILSDGVHPTLEGATVIANEWLRAFEALA
jgi:lysophospholipase L1-like esterase